MKLHKAFKNSRAIIFGTGTHAEVETLNRAEDFETALRVLGQIRNTRKIFFDSREPGRMNRMIYGRRKAG